MLYYTVLCYSVSPYIILHNTINILYYLALTILRHYIILLYSISLYTILHNTIRNTMLYYTTVGVTVFAEHFVLRMEQVFMLEQ